MLQYLNSRGRFLLSLSNVSTANEQPCRGITMRHPISSNLSKVVIEGSQDSQGMTENDLKVINEKVIAVLRIV
jgi:hypothetical protein